MPQPHVRRSIRRVDAQVSIFTALVVIFSCLCIYAFHYKFTYDNMIDSLAERVESMHSYIENILTSEIFQSINSPEDMSTPLYQTSQEAMFSVKQATGVQYFYTAKRTEDGRFIYVIDGLNPGAADFRRPGDAIEPEIIPELERALAGEAVMPDAIKDTAWGKIFIAYLPVHGGPGGTGDVMGVVGIEFAANAQYDTYQALKIATPLVALLACLLSAAFAYFFFRRISNPTFQDLANTDYLTQLKNRNAFETDMKNLDARRDQRGIGVILIDLNDLKLVNDTLGHESGDLYLQTAARAIRESIPDSAVSYRVGGDEFVILLRVDSVGILRQHGAVIRTRFDSLSPKDWPVSLSFSLGCACFCGEDGTIFATYRRADRDMYREKQAYHQDSQQKDADR